MLLIYAVLEQSIVKSARTGEEGDSKQYLRADYATISIWDISSQQWTVKVRRIQKTETEQLERNVDPPFISEDILVGSHFEPVGWCEAVLVE